MQYLNLRLLLKILKQSFTTEYSFITVCLSLLYQTEILSLSATSDKLFVIFQILKLNDLQLFTLRQTDKLSTLTSQLRYIFRYIQTLCRMTESDDVLLQSFVRSMTALRHYLLSGARQHLIGPSAVSLARLVRASIQQTARSLIWLSTINIFIIISA